MDRTAALEKIKNMLALQASTNHEGEYAAAAHLIERLCEKYGVTINEAGKPIAKDEQFGDEFKRLNKANALIINAVGKYYGAQPYLKTDTNSIKTFNLIGTEKQQIETQLYYDFIVDVMEKEAAKAYQAEKIIAEITGSTVNRSFLNNFRAAFASTISDRLFEMKKERDYENDEHCQAVKEALTTKHFNTRTRHMRAAVGAGGLAGGAVGSNVSLTRQAGSGARQRQLAGR